MSRLTLEEYLNERINDVNTYIEFNERKQIMERRGWYL